MITMIPAHVPAPEGDVAQETRRADFTRKESALWRLIANTQSKSGQTKTMRRLIRRIALTLGATVTVDHGNVYATKGTPPEGVPYPCIVAHTDTIFTVIPQGDFEVRRVDGGKWCAVDRGTLHKDKDGDDIVYYCGIGGDDKCGIWLALNAMREFPYMKCAFFRDEEVGCQGSHEATMEFFDDVAFVLQGDRRGNGDFVNEIGGSLQSKDFGEGVKPILQRHGFAFSHGASTDVGALADEGIGVSVANMSAGYWNYHQSDEYVVEGDLLKTRHLMHDIVIEMGDKRWDFVRPKRSYAVWTKKDHDDWDDPTTWSNNYDAEQLAMAGFAKDPEGFWVMDPDAMALWTAEEAAFGWNYNKPCPWCHSTDTTWVKGRHICQMTEWKIKQNGGVDGGCGKTLPIPRHTMEDRHRTANRLNKEREASLARQAAKDEEKNGGGNGTFRPKNGVWTIGPNGIIIPLNADEVWGKHRAVDGEADEDAIRRHIANNAPLGDKLKAINDQIDHDLRTFADHEADTEPDSLDLMASRPRPEECPHCGSPGMKGHWHPNHKAWCCKVCYSFDDETASQYRRRRASHIVQVLQGRGDAPWNMNHQDRSAVLDIIMSWLEDGEREDDIAHAITDMVAGAVEEEGNSIDVLDDHDGHDGTPYQGQKPDCCATCGEPAIVYDIGEDAWLCLGCHKYTVVLGGDGFILSDDQTPPETYQD